MIALAAPAAALAAEPVPDPGSSAIAAQAPLAAPPESYGISAYSDARALVPGDGQGEVVIDGPFVTPTPQGQRP